VIFNHAQKPFLTVETGEAYQPIRLVYDIHQKEQLLASLNTLTCCIPQSTGSGWTWFWMNECDEVRFESLDTYHKNPSHPVRLGSLSIRDNKFYLSLPSFKRACLAVTFFYRFIHSDIARVQHADFINKVFGLDERMPRSLNELFNDEELEIHIKERNLEYERIQQACENAENPEEAFKILATYTESEAKKKLPYTERYAFLYNEIEDMDTIFLSFYVFLRGRELVAIRRWFGDAKYSLANVAEESIEKVFGKVDIDPLE